jgi:transposase
LAEGRSPSEVLEITKYAVSTARTISARYRDLGLIGLKDGRHDNQGAPTVLSGEEQQALAARVAQDFEQGIVWEGKQVQAWIQAQFGKTVYLGRTYEFLRAAGFSPQKPRPHHVKGDELAKEAFKTKS